MPVTVAMFAAATGVVAAIIAAVPAGVALSDYRKRRQRDYEYEHGALYILADILADDMCIHVFNAGDEFITDVKIEFDERDVFLVPESDEFGLTKGGISVGLIPPRMKYIRPYLVHVSNRDDKDRPEEMAVARERAQQFRTYGYVNVSFRVSDRKLIRRRIKIRTIDGLYFEKDSEQSAYLAGYDYRFGEVAALGRVKASLDSLNRTFERFVRK